MKRQITESELEQAFEQIAAAVDRVGREQESEFLAQLCLALATQLPSIDPIAEAIQSAEAGLKRK